MASNLDSNKNGFFLDYISTTYLFVLFQYNAWATPCNKVVECDKEEDEKICHRSNWHQWIAITSILLFFILLFFSLLKIKVKEKEKVLNLQLQPVQCNKNLCLDKNYRGQLAFRLETGGRDEAVKIYDQIQKHEFHQKWYLKVCKSILKRLADIVSKSLLLL